MDEEIKQIFGSVSSDKHFVPSTISILPKDRTVLNVTNGQNANWTYANYFILDKRSPITDWSINNGQYVVYKLENEWCLADYKKEILAKGIEAIKSFVNIHTTAEKLRVKFLQRLMKGNPDSIPTEANYTSYLAAMRAKPFLLLAGISGTGKSRIVKEMAFASCPPSLRDEREVSPGNYCMVEVKPNWHDSTELLGYYSSIAEKYIVTPFINFLVKAWMNPKAPFFVCLDEMNLAPVEQYFAEFLSVLESRKLQDGVIVSEALIKPDVVKKHVDDFKRSYYGVDAHDRSATYASIVQGVSNIWSSFIENGISLPPNLIVVGTVNMDETTYQFSRKVIDRAMTIEMNEVDFDAMLDTNHKDTLKYRSNYVSAEYFLPKYAAARDAFDSLLSENDRRILQQDAVEQLKALDTVLKDTPFRVAYRVQNELVLYFAALREEQPDVEGATLLNRVFDDILMMKVLPRIQGGDEMREPLEKLQKWTATSLPKANAKIAEMQRGLDQKHFTSYWP